MLVPHVRDRDECKTLAEKKKKKDDEMSMFNEEVKNRRAAEGE